MAGVPPLQQAIAAATPWIRGPNATAASLVSGQLPAPQTRLGESPLASGSLRPCPPNLVFSELPQSFGAPQPLQFQPGVSPQSGQKFMPPTSRQFHPETYARRQGTPQTTMGVSPAVQPQLAQYPPQVQQFPLLPGQQSQPPSSQVISASFTQQPPPASLSQVFSAPHPQQPLSASSSQLLSASYSQQPQPSPSLHVLSSTYSQQQRPMINGNLPSQSLNVPTPAGLWGLRMPPSSSFTFVTSLPRGQSQSSLSANPPSNQAPAQSPQIPTQSVSPISSAHASQNDVSGRPQGIYNGGKAVVGATTLPVAAAQATSSNLQISTDWQEHTNSDGKRYFYNKKTRQSSWEKPFELLSPIERADASTDWKEFTTPDGRTYYYNKVTKQSKWTMPEEMEAARKQAVQAAMPINVPKTEAGAPVVSPVSVAITASPLIAFPNMSFTSFYSTNKTSRSALATSVTNVATMPQSSSSLSCVAPLIETPSAGVMSSAMLTSISASPYTTVSLPVTVVAPTPSPLGTALLMASTSAATMSVVTSTSIAEATSLGTSAGKMTADPETAPTAAVSSSMAASSAAPSLNLEKASLHDSKEGGIDKSSAQNLEVAKKAVPITGKINVTPLLEEKSIHVTEEPLSYANKTEAKIAFKQLLESAHVESDWTWDQAMRVIINDKRYGALKSLAERRQAFNEYSAQRKKQETEEKRLKQKRDREEFVKMLEECKELTSTMRWSKAVSLFEIDQRFHAIERGREREELFEDYVLNLERKERDRAHEQRKKNLSEYREFLATCDFIKANTQWRKVQDQLVKDKRCYRLDPIDRLKVFQEYVRDLEIKEEEERRIKKEQLRRKEHKNRDEFRKLIEEHRSSGVLTAKTSWSDYFLRVKDYPAYQEAASNTSGLTPKELFEDVLEELEKQYHTDRARIKEAMKTMKIIITSTSTFDKFKAIIAEAGDIAMISESNLKHVFEEVRERTRDKEEKEAKKRQQLADDFKKLLLTRKEIYVSSRWEDCKSFLEETREYRAIKDSTIRRNLFDEYIADLQQIEKEKERELEEEKEKERKKRKEIKDRDKEHARVKKEWSRKDKDYTNQNFVERDSAEQTEDRWKDEEKENNRKHKKHHHKTTEDDSSAKDNKEDCKKSHKHRKKSSRKHGHESGSHREHRHKRHRRDQDESMGNGSAKEHEEGEVKDDGEFH